MFFLLFKVFCPLCAALASGACDPVCHIRRDAPKRAPPLKRERESSHAHSLSQSPNGFPGVSALAVLACVSVCAPGVSLSAPASSAVSSPVRWFTASPGVRCESSHGLRAVLRLSARWAVWVCQGTQQRGATHRPGRFSRLPATFPHYPRPALRSRVGWGLGFGFRSPPVLRSRMALDDIPAWYLARAGFGLCSPATRWPVLCSVFRCQGSRWRMGKPYRQEDDTMGKPISSYKVVTIFITIYDRVFPWRGGLWRGRFALVRRGGCRLSSLRLSVRLCLCPGLCGSVWLSVALCRACASPWLSVPPAASEGLRASRAPSSPQSCTGTPRRICPCEALGCVLSAFLCGHTHIYPPT